MKKLRSRMRTAIVLIMLIMFIGAVLPNPNVIAQTDFGDIVLSGSDSMTITGSGECKNVTLSDDATLIVESGFLEIGGLLRMSDNARLFVIRGTVRLQPPPMNDSTMVVHATDGAMIYVQEGSSMVFKPQPTATNISYMLLEDEVSFFLVDSLFSGDLPTIINQSIETASVTAGVYLLSGSASWYMQNSDVTGSVSSQGRWFWCSLHQRSTLFIENTDLDVFSDRALHTVLKPVSGVTTIINSRMLDGSLDAEVTAEVFIENSTFASSVELKDQSIVKIINSTFQRDVTIGSKLGIIQVENNPETEVDIENSVFERYLYCKGNSTTRIENSEMRNIIVESNATADIFSSMIQNLLSINDKASANLNEVELRSIIMDETASCLVENCEEISTITLYGSGEKEDGYTLQLLFGSVKNLILYPDFTSSVWMSNATPGNISFYNNVNATFLFAQSMIGNLRPMGTMSNVTLSLILIDTDPPDLSTLDTNVSVNILHRLGVMVELNGEPIEISVTVTSQSQVISQGLSKSGAVFFDLLYKSIVNGSETITEDYTISALYLGFSEEMDVKMTSSKTVTINFVDETPPEIIDITFGPSEWNQGKDITVSANLRDSGIMSIATAKLCYKIDQGDWKETMMFNIEGDVYEAQIPGQGGYKEVTFYISSEDMAGNSLDSPTQTITVGREENNFFWGALLVLIVLLTIVMLKKISDIRKVKRYTHKYEREGDAK